MAGRLVSVVHPSPRGPPSTVASLLLLLYKKSRVGKPERTPLWKLREEGVSREGLATSDYCTKGRSFRNREIPTGIETRSLGTSLVEAHVGSWRKNPVTARWQDAKVRGTPGRRQLSLDGWLWKDGGGVTRKNNIFRMRGLRMFICWRAYKSISYTK